MIKGKNKMRKLILTSGFSWIFLLSIARSHKIVRLEPTLEDYIFGIASQPLSGLLWVGGMFTIFIISMIVMGKPAVLVMVAIFTLIIFSIIIHNGKKTNLTISETMKMAYLHIRKSIFIRH